MLSKLKKTIIAVFLLNAVFIAKIATAQEPLEKAKYLTYSENFEDAQKAFENLINLQPKNGDIYFYYGENFLYQYYTDTLFSSKQYAANNAEIWFKKGIVADSNNPLNYVGMGKIALMRNDLAKAKQFFAKAETKFPSKANKTSTITPQKQALTLAKIAEAYVVVTEKRNVTPALELLERAVTLDAKNPEIYLIYGDAYVETNDGSKAISQFKMAQDLDPKSPSAKLALGNLWIKARNWEEAINYYNEAIQIDSTFAPAFLQLGKLYSKANKLDKALYYFKKYDEMSTNISAKIKYVNVLIESKKYDDALLKLNEISAKDSSRNDLNRAFAYCYFETSKYDKALKSIRKFFSNAGEGEAKVSDFSYHGKILSKNNLDSLAIIEFNKAYEMDTAQKDVLSDIAGSYTKMKQYDMAAAYYEKKIAFGKSGMADYYKLGTTYYNAKNWTNASKAFEYVIANKPDFQGGRSYYWQGLTNANIDSTSTTWQAKPYFDKFVEMVKNDSVKFAKDLVVTYDYLGSYYFLSSEKDVSKARVYWNKIVAIDPKNERALELLNKTKDK